MRSRPWPVTWWSPVGLGTTVCVPARSWMSRRCPAGQPSARSTARSTTRPRSSTAEAHGPPSTFAAVADPPGAALPGLAMQPRRPRPRGQPSAAGRRARSHRRPSSDPSRRGRGDRAKDRSQGVWQICHRGVSEGGFEHLFVAPLRQAGVHVSNSTFGNEPRERQREGPRRGPLAARVGAGPTCWTTSPTAPGTDPPRPSTAPSKRYAATPSAFAT